MKIIILFLFLVLIGCNDIPDKKTKDQHTISLAGTNWTSEFYHYKNKYFFQTDSTGYSEDGQFCWSTPIDPALYHNSRDSVAYQGPDTFRYSFKDTVLTLNYEGFNRVFRLGKEKEEIYFVSEYEYAYGHEILNKKKK